MLRSKQRRLKQCGGFVCFVLPLLTFVFILNADFVMWDDDRAIIDNPLVGGLSFERLPVIFGDLQSTSHFTPATGLYRSLIYELFPPTEAGLSAFGYHFGSWLLHATSTLLLYLICYELFTILRKRQGKKAGPLLRQRQVFVCVVAALFWSLHPLRVEPVAWASSGNHCLATTFLFLSIWFYLKHAQFQGPISRDPMLWYALLAYVLSLLSHPIGIGFFLVLVVLDLFPLRRLQLSTACWKAGRDRAVLIEKLPFLLAGVLVALVTIGLQMYHPQYSDPPSPPWDQFGLFARVMQGFYVWTYYVWRIWFPVNLSPTYTTLSQFNPLGLIFVFSAAGFLLISILAWLFRKRVPGLLAGWCCHLIMIFPVLGLTQMNHVANDRYALTVSVIWSLFFVGLMTRSYRSEIYRAVMGGSLLLVMSLAIASHQQVRIWHDTEALFEHVLKVLGDDPAREDIHFRLGRHHWNLYRYHGSEQELKSALEAVKESIRIRPGHAEAHVLYATILFQSERYDEVLSEVQFVLDEEILQHDALCLRGMVHMQRKQWEAAEATFQKVLKEDPLFPLAVQKMAEVKMLKQKNKAP